MKTWWMRIFALSASVCFGLAIVAFTRQARELIRSAGKIESLSTSFAPTPTPTPLQQSGPPTHQETAMNIEFMNVSIPKEFENGDAYSLIPVSGGSPVAGCGLTSEITTPWLGLFKRGNKYSLERVKARFGQPLKDDLAGFVPISLPKTKNSVVFFSHGDTIKPGPAKTLYSPRKDDDFAGIGFRKDLDIGGLRYTLRISSGTRGTEPVLVAVLEEGGKQDVLYFGPDDGFGLGRFEWVGDIDDDQKLDVLFFFYALNGGYERQILFLSSAAKNGHLVKPYAFYSGQFGPCDVDPNQER